MASSSLGVKLSDSEFRQYRSRVGGGPSVADARVININGPTPQVSQTSPMAFGRRQFDLTDLADGSVLATGGNSSGTQFVDMKPYLDRLDELVFEELDTQLIAPTHGLPIRDPLMTMKEIRRGFLESNGSSASDELLSKGG